MQQFVALKAGMIICNQMKCELDDAENKNSQPGLFIHFDSVNKDQIYLPEKHLQKVIGESRV